MLKIYQKFCLFYDKLYGGNFYSSYVFFIDKMIKKYRLKNPRILDIACGTAKLIEGLKKKYQNIEGIDASEEMLKIAQNKNKEVKFYHQSLPDFDTGKKYNVITCTFDSVNYLTKKKSLGLLFKKISQHLEPRDLFIFDFNTIYKRVKKIETKGGCVFINNLKNNYWEAAIKMNVGGKIFTEKHKERFYSYKEIKSVLDGEGFKIAEVYSSLDKKINQPDRCQRLVIVARKIS